MTHLTDKHGGQRPSVTYEHGSAVLVRVYDGSRIIARSRYDRDKGMIVSLWVDQRHRRNGLAYAIVKSLWQRHPDAIGKYPKLRMSQAMHGFLTSLMQREGIAHNAPPEKLRGRL